MKLNKLYIVSASMAALTFLGSCSDSWLEPKPLSFYTPENTYIDKAGLDAALTACERNMRGEYYGDGCPILTEIIQSEEAVEGTTDKSGPQMDMDITLLPNASLNSENSTRTGWYWMEGYKGIKYANVIISRIDQATFSDESEKNAILGAAYFQRAYRYYKLTHQYGNVPYLGRELAEPKTDFYTNDRFEILEQMKTDMEFAYQWVPEQVDRGKTSKAACGMLLAKICMALYDGQNSYLDRAIEVCKEIVANHPLMTQRFTSNKDVPHTNLMFDLHSVEAKMDQSNTEGLMYVVSYPDIDGSVTMQIMRQAVPFWNNGAVKTPDGDTGTSVKLDPSDPDSMDMNKIYGRGIGRLRSTNYSQYQIWTSKEKKDLRGVYNRDSWKRPEDLYYNNPSLKASGSSWYGKHLIKPTAMSLEDTIRCWYQWPQYKTFVPDPRSGNNWSGGESPWYIYRSAETYLMMAECYYWKNELANAALMMNVVRERAGADPLTAADINIGEILNERARELYYEETRHIEEVRISYMYARSGKACEVFGGRTYSLDQLSGPGGTNSNVKKEGYNFWWDWVNKNSNFYNKDVVTKWATYKISVHHMLWPIPSSAITANTTGHINQNIGYPGAENNVPVKSIDETETVAEN